MIVYRLGNDTFAVRGVPFVTGEGDEAVQHPANALDLYTADDLARFGITAEEVEDPPAPVARSELPKTTVMQRLVDLGKAAAVKALFTGSVQGFVYWQKWNAPGWPNVYKDDPDLLAAFAALGLTDAEIAQVLA